MTASELPSLAIVLEFEVCFRIAVVAHSASHFSPFALVIAYIN